MILSIARQKKQTWFHRLYLVIQSLAVGLAIIGMGAVWVASYFQSGQPEPVVAGALCVAAATPAVLLALVYRVVLFICYGRGAFEFKTDPRLP